MRFRHDFVMLTQVKTASQLKLPLPVLFTKYWRAFLISLEIYEGTGDGKHLRGKLPNFGVRLEHRVGNTNIPGLKLSSANI